MSSPYKSLPDHAFWRRAVGDVAPGLVNPATRAPFSLAPGDAVMTAGSCFAQYIGEMLQATGFTYLVTEPAHPLFQPEQAKAYNYGVFSARYGNVYTARALLQLFERAYGRFTPREDMWVEPDGSVLDPFRPQIQPGGFLSRREFELDRLKHLAAVRSAFERLDVLVFTLGLTEAWISREDGAVFTICPGTSGGVFDPARHVFHNFTVAEVVADMCAFIDALRQVNPRAKLILTVSPVPLAATARAAAHVLAATTYSKSVLRVAAEMLTQLLPNVAYFPAYEIIMSRAFDAGTYFAQDKRNVVGPGVAHVMRVFAETFAGTAAPPPAPAPRTAAEGGHMRQMETLMQVHCDEVALDPG
jgi:hypothetical protein